MGGKQSKNDRTEPELITEIEIKDALSRSGYLLEQRAEQTLSERYSTVAANVAYPDPETGKSREYDLNAFKMEAFGSRATLFHNLIIECRNNPQPVAFIMKPRLGGDRIDDIQARPAKVTVDDKEWDTRAFVDRFRKKPASFSTQYFGFVPTKSSGNEPVQWLATHEESQLEAFKKLCDIVFYTTSSIRRQEVRRHSVAPYVELFYPVLLLQGNIYEVTASNSGVALKKTQHVAFKQSRIQDRRQIEYTIDVITERFLPEFIEARQAEVSALVERLEENDRALIDALRTEIEREEKNRPKSSLSSSQWFE